MMELNEEIYRGIYGANNQPQDVPVDKITHMLYAFADIKEDGSV